jgi:transcriptional regulator with XRE-family HTH domain
MVMVEGCATVAGGTRRGSILGFAPPPSDARRSELTDFLRRRRDVVSPESVGLEANGRRRTPGLRREEVAQLAGVGLSWYTWLEQGRDIKPSASMLDALARVLRPDAAERAHLFSLARVELPLPAGDYPREAPAELAELVAALQPNPAYLLGPNRRPGLERRHHPPPRRAVPSAGRQAEPPVVDAHVTRRAGRAVA